MLRFFRSHHSAVIVAILFIGILTWLNMLINPVIVPSERYETFMYQAFNGWLVKLPEIRAWCGLMLFLLTAVLLVYVNTRFRLIDKISYLPALCYVLLIGGVTEIHLFNPAVFAAILLVTAFFFLAKSFESDRLSYSYFVAPIFISTATFFYPYMYAYMLAVWLAIAFYRPAYWREWVFSILGYAVPLFFAFSWFFLMDDDYTRMGVFFHEIFTIQRVMPSISIPSIGFIALTVAIVALAFGYLTRYLGSKKVVIRNRYYVLILITFTTLILILAVPDMLPLAWYLLSFPMSFFLSYFLATIKSMRWGNVVLFLLFAAVIAVQAFFLSTG